MAADLLAALAGRRPEIRAQWEALLRTEPFRTPLGQPDTLVHLIDSTLDEFFAALARALDRPANLASYVPSTRPTCPCGRNPLLAFFTAGEQALHEALILIQSAAGPMKASERDFGFFTVDAVLRRIAHREVDALCSVCLTRPAAAEATPAPMPAEEKSKAASPTTKPSPPQRTRRRRNKGSAARTLSLPGLQP
jgi:hypothetical protein